MLSWNPKKSELPKFILPVKFSWLIVLQFLGWKWKICRDQSRLTFSSCSFTARFRARGYAAHAHAPTWVCLQAIIELAQDSTGSIIIYALGLFCVNFTAPYPYCQDLGEIISQYSLGTWLIREIYTITPCLHETICLENHHEYCLALHGHDINVHEEGKMLAKICVLVALCMDFCLPMFT